MKKIIALGASSSKNSINKTLAIHVASKVADASITVLDLNDYKLPLYNVDAEEESGIPEAAHQFNNIIQSADGLVISLAEHNGTYTAVFKNLFDWLSRIDIKVWKDIPMFLLATSPGGQGGGTVLAAAKSGFPYMGGNIIVDFSLPSFYENFSNAGITNSELSSILNEKIGLFEHSLEQEEADIHQKL
ncbi:MAG: NAD(P)H-dependent oxidoreductase [Reichenbachiella sp.]|uniref:NADPH-dependent FMN reductase n=1 Tax=Reichenbachiella sp. TaxID=2184521 RepID=UPI0029664D8C|nr:NAD(P)H-dependent oxidoreductase [Reichenbachiella sp.]MDW3210622.1 NAD(P)H-dependent oxidoreductase [Reichenbachiella sp.]